ncbi:MAG: PD40 domain-containing protein, partial [Caldilineaceae bacterium]|nr:PD40 domain-containing protein [Caldilineaceae bacterium]
IVHGHQFMNNDWGPIGEYENARWLMGYLSVEYKTNCSELDTNDNIAFSSSSSSATNAGVMVMNSAGGDVRKIASLEVRNSYFLSVQCPTWSPEGDEIAFFKRTGLDFGDIFIVRNDGANSRNSTNNPYWYGKLVWSPDGTRFVYHTGYADSIQLIDVDSPLSHLAGISMSDGNPNWSPDSQLLVFDSTLSSTTAGIYMIKVDGSEPRQITDNPWMDTDPSWSPDGSKIAFVSNRDGDNEIFTMDVNGANVQQLTNNTSVDSDPVWSHNGAHIAFVSDRDGNNEIYVMNADGSNQHNVTNTPHQEYCPDWFGVR